MVMSDSTLADDLIREWSSKKYRTRVDLQGWVPRQVALARKFSLDDEMSAFMADLAYASMPSLHSPRRVAQWLDGLRVMSRLPHDLTWIEYDMKKRAARSRDAYNAQLASYTGPQRCGWLIRRLVDNEVDIGDGVIRTREGEWFEAVPCSSQSMSSDDWVTGRLLDIPNAGPFGYVWTTGADPLPNVEWLEKSDYIISRALTGIDSYRSAHVTLTKAAFVVSNPAMMKVVDEMKPRRYLEEQAGDLRYLWALLATINDLPILRTQIKPDRGHMVRGSYKRFSEHTMITLRVPGRASLSAVARRALRASRRRAHQVRGHWRVDWRAAPAALCEHVWVSEDGQVRCRECKGRKTWIHEHQRGDASVGFVLHDYAVQRAS